MSEDHLLRKLGQVAREEAESEPSRLDERWDRLAASTLSAEEEGELRRLAETSEDARLAYEAFRPLGAEFEARIVETLATRTAVTEESPAQVSEAAAMPGTGAGTSGRVLPFRGTVRRLMAWGTTVGAAAAAMVALLLRTSTPLPLYTMAELSGGSRTTRGDLTEAPTFMPGAKCGTVLTPDTAVSRPSTLGTAAFLLRDEEVRPFRVESEEVDPNSGAVRVMGTLDRDLPPGDWTLWMVVGRKGKLPGPAEVGTFAGEKAVHERNWVALPKRLHVQPRAPD